MTDLNDTNCRTCLEQGYDDWALRPSKNSLFASQIGFPLRSGPWILTAHCLLSFFFLLLMTWMMLSRWVSGFQVSPVACFSPNIPVAKHFHRSSSVKVRARNRGSVKMGTQKGTISPRTYHMSSIHGKLQFCMSKSYIVCFGVQVTASASCRSPVLRLLLWVRSTEPKLSILFFTCTPVQMAARLWATVPLHSYATKQQGLRSMCSYPVPRFLF